MRRLLALILMTSCLTPAACGSSAAPATSAPAATPAATASPLEPESPVPSSSEATVEWTALAPAGEGFSVDMPGEPQVQETSFDTAVGPAPATFWMVLYGNEGGVFVMHATYPEGSVPAGAEEQLLTSALEGAAATQTNPDITQQEFVTLNGHKGLAFTMTISQGELQGGIYIKGDELYLAYAGYKPDSDYYTNVVTRFLESFSLDA